MWFGMIGMTTAAGCVGVVTGVVGLCDVAAGADDPLVTGAVVGADDVAVNAVGTGVARAARRWLSW
jgi:hypothetical protein